MLIFFYKILHRTVTMKLLHTCISYLDSYVCMKHSDAAVTETFAYLCIIFLTLIYVWNIATPLWLWSFCISVYHIMTLIYVWNIATSLRLWSFCISICHNMTLIYVLKQSDIAVTRKLLHIYKSYYGCYICMKHSDATVTHICISYLHILTLSYMFEA